MTRYPLFLSVVLVVRNRATQLREVLQEYSRLVAELATDYELIVVDNASDDDTMKVLKELTSENGLPNLQVFALTKEVDEDSAAWGGIENALGDFVAVIDPMQEDLHFLPTLLEAAMAGSDVVFAENTLSVKQTLWYRACSGIFNAIYKRLLGVRLASEAPRYRLLSKRVVNYVLQHPAPALAYRYLPATAGFARTNLSYASQPLAPRQKRLWDSIDRGTKLLVSTTHAPMRLVTGLSFFGAAANIVYSGYVIAVGLLKEDVEPGWVTLSLQQSGMFFLLSLVLLVLGEYVLNMARLTTEGPPYHVAQELTSAVMTRQQKLNVEQAGANTAEPKFAVITAPRKNVG